jgi:hypothetical protein
MLDIARPQYIEKAKKAYDEHWYNRWFYQAMAYRVIEAYANNIE